MGNAYFDYSANQQNRQAQATNAPSWAMYATTYSTTGNGYFVDPSPIMFGCSFLTEPSFSHGIAIDIPPDPAHYQWPVANAGVYDWVLEDNPADAGKAADDPTRAPFYVGAYVYFVVKVDPLIYPRTDGSNLADLQNALTLVAKGTTAYTHVQACITEANEALFLTANPPQCVLSHTISFSQVAMKDLTDPIQNTINSDPELVPNVPTYGGTITAKGS